MPIPFIVSTFRQGSASLRFVTSVLKVIPWIGLLVALKYFFGGARNRSERVMHGKVVILTVRSSYPFIQFLISLGRHVGYWRYRRKRTRKPRGSVGLTYLSSAYGPVPGRLHRRSTRNNEQRADLRRAGGFGLTSFGSELCYTLD